MTQTAPAKTIDREKAPGTELGTNGKAEIERYDPAVVAARTTLMIRRHQCQSILDAGILGDAVTDWRQVNALWMMAEARGMNVVEAVCGQAIYCAKGQVGYYASFLHADAEREYGTGIIRILTNESDGQHAVAEFKQPGWDGVQRMEAWLTADIAPVRPGAEKEAEPIRQQYRSASDLKQRTFNYRKLLPLLRAGVKVPPPRLLNNYGWQENSTNQLERWLLRQVTKTGFPKTKHAEASARHAYNAALTEDLPLAQYQHLKPPSAEAMALEAGSDENGTEAIAEADTNEVEEAIEAEWAGSDAGQADVHEPPTRHINHETGVITETRTEAPRSNPELTSARSQLIREIDAAANDPSVSKRVSDWLKSTQPAGASLRDLSNEDLEHVRRMVQEPLEHQAAETQKPASPEPAEDRDALEQLVYRAWSTDRALAEKQRNELRQAYKSDDLADLTLAQLQEIAEGWRVRLEAAGQKQMPV